MRTRDTVGAPRPGFIVRNRQRRVVVDTAGLARCLSDLSGILDISAKEVAVVLVSDQAIRRRNRAHRMQDRPTDVLSYAVSRGYGELFLSAQTAARNAARFRRGLEDELVYLVIHGCLHLDGWLDYDRRDRRRMKNATDRIYRRYRRARIRRGPRP